MPEDEAADSLDDFLDRSAIPCVSTDLLPVVEVGKPGWSRSEDGEEIEGMGTTTVGRRGEEDEPEEEECRSEESEGRPGRDEVWMGRKNLGGERGMVAAAGDWKT